MKNKIAFLIVSMLITVNLYSQNPGDNISLQIAKKMRDSLLLNNLQFDNIYKINMAIAGNKANVRSRFTSIDSITVGIQHYENQRDSLYRTALGSEEKYLLYKQKKNNILKTN